MNKIKLFKLSLAVSFVGFFLFITNVTHAQCGDNGTCFEERRLDWAEGCEPSSFGSFCVQRWTDQKLIECRDRINCSYERWDWGVCEGFDLYPECPSKFIFTQGGCCGTDDDSGRDTCTGTSAPGCNTRGCNNIRTCQRRSGADPTCVCRCPGGGWADISGNKIGDPPSGGPITVASGETFELHWSASNVEGCTLDGTGVPDNVSGQRTSLTADHIYNFSCSRGGNCGSYTDSFVVNVIAALPPSCTLNPGDVNLVPGATVTLPISINTVNGAVDSITVTVSNSAVASVCETSAASCPPGVASATDNTLNPPDLNVLKITGYAPGSGTYTVSGDMDDVGNTACGPVPPAPPNDLTGNITVSNTQSWWQVVGGDVIAGGLSGIIRSLLPTLVTPCDSPSCERYLIRDNPLDNPGVPSAGSGTDYGGGTASSRSWNAEGSAFLASKIPDYATFEARIPAAAAPEEITSSSVNGLTFENGGTPYGGYYWYKYVGSSSTFTIDPPLDLGGNPIPAQLGDRRVVLFVKDADLVINSKIFATPGLGGIYVIVDRNITIDPTVGDTEVTLDLADPDLEGLFYADGQIFTGSDGVAPDNDPQLFVRGSLAGLGMNPNPGDSDGVVFQRKLSDNTNKPGEIIEFAPDLVLSWPPYLSGKNITWREVVP